MLEKLNDVSGVLVFAITILVERKRIYAAILEIIQEWSKPRYVSVVQSQNQVAAQDTPPRKVKKAGINIFSKLAFFFKSLIAIAGSALSFSYSVVWVKHAFLLNTLLSEDAQLWLIFIFMVVGTIFGAVFLRKKPWAVVIFVPLGVLLISILGGIGLMFFQAVLSIFQ
jgi:hypothetical protein